MRHSPPCHPERRPAGPESRDLPDEAGVLRFRGCSTDGEIPPLARSAPSVGMTVWESGSRSLSRTRSGTGTGSRAEGQGGRGEGENTSPGCASTTGWSRGRALKDAPTLSREPSFPATPSPTPLPARGGAKPWRGAREGIPGARARMDRSGQPTGAAQPRAIPSRSRTRTQPGSRSRSGSGAGTGSESVAGARAGGWGSHGWEGVVAPRTVGWMGVAPPLNLFRFTFHLSRFTNGQGQCHQCHGHGRCQGQGRGRRPGQGRKMPRLRGGGAGCRFGRPSTSSRRGCTGWWWRSRCRSRP